MSGFTALQDTLILGTRQVAPEPGFIVGPIAQVFGIVMDVLFNIVYAIGPAHSLGFSIILLTLVFRFAMLPLSIKSQKSMIKMQQLKPEQDKIRAKYGNSKDPEIQKKITAETTALWAKHKVNPLSGCLPMLLQMPLFFGLNFIMQQAFLYVTRLRDLYSELASNIIAAPGALPYLHNIAYRFLPNSMLQNGVELQRLVEQGTALDTALDQVGDVIVLNIPEHLSRILNRFTLTDWENLFAEISNNAPQYLPYIQTLFNRRQEIEVFFGLPIVEPSGWGLPGILIPIMVALTTFLSAWLSQQINKGTSTDQMKTQQTIMLVVMPFVMGFVTVNFPAGVGIFWITSSVFQVGQQLIMNKQAGVKLELPFLSKKEP